MPKGSVLNAFSKLKLSDRKVKAATGNRNPFDLLGESSHGAAKYTGTSQASQSLPRKHSLSKQVDGDQANEEPIETADSGVWTDVKRRAPIPAQPTKDLQPLFPPGGRTARSTVNHLTDNNWRDRNPEKLKARYEDACTIGNTYKTRQSRMTHIPGPRTIGGVLFANQKPGALLWHWDIRPLQNPDARPYGWEIFTKPDGSHWMKKGRYWIVVDVTGEIVSEVAIYTNGNTGLEKVKDRSLKNYFALRPKHVRAKDFKDPKISGTGNPVLAVEWMEDQKDHIEGRLVRTTMVVNWAEVRERDINVPELRLVGALADESTKQLHVKALGRSR